jgi:DNA-binding Xre family transcriptional regulator
MRKEVREVREVREERSRQVAAIKRGAKTTNEGRSHLLPGLRACRLAAGISQRELAAKIGGTQATVRQLEREYRGAFVSTIAKLCEALEVMPEDLLCAGDVKREEAHR